MGEIATPALPAALHSLREQARQRLLAAADAGAGPSDELLYQTMLSLQHETLQQARTEAAALRAALGRAPGQLLEASSEAIFLLRDNHIIDCNAAALALVQATDKSQLQGCHIAELAPAVQPSGALSREQAEAARQRAAEAAGSYHYEWLGRKCTGEEFWGAIHLAPVTLNGQNYLQVKWRDLTPLKPAERQDREIEENRQRALNAAAVGTVVYDKATNQVLLDAPARAILNLPPSNGPISCDVVRDLIHPADVAPAAEALAQAQHRGGPLVVEVRVVWANGAVHYVRFRGEVERTAQGQPGRLLGVLRDISAQREAEAELNHKTRVLENIVQNMPVVLGRLTPEGVYQELVGLGLRRLGMQDNQLRGANLLEVFPPLAEQTRRLLAGESVNFVGSAIVEGQQVSFQNYGFFDEQKQEAVIFGIDVTESEQMKVKLREEKDFTKHLLDHSLDALIALDTDLRVTAWNQTAARYSSLSEAQVLGSKIFELLPHLDTVDLRQLLERVLQGTPNTLYNQPFRQRPGTYDLYLIPLYPSHGQQVTGLLAIIRDVTERNRMLTDAVRVQRQQQQTVLQAVFAAQEVERKRIAEALHNGVGQLLYVTKLALENQQQQSGYPPDPAVMHILNEAIQATRTVSHQLTPGILEDFGLEVALTEMTKHIPAHELRVHLHLQGLHQPRPLSLDLAVYRIIQELISNVIKHAQAREVNVQVEQEENQMVLSVQDDGVGVEASPSAAAPGMGLASIRNRTELLGGRYALDSRPGQGTTVRVALPL